MSKVINIKDLVSKDKSDPNQTIQERFSNCFREREVEGKCGCRYCIYHKEAAKMAVDFIAQDITTWEKNNGMKICTHDLKEIFFDAIQYLNEMEKNDKEEDIE